MTEIASGVAITARFEDDRDKNRGCWAQRTDRGTTYHLILAAETLGLGSCLIGFITAAAARSRTIREKVGLPKGHRIYASLAVGYPAERFFRLVPRNPPNVQVRS
jgi:nitroreductase